MYLPIFAGVASYSGLPATAFPWGRTRDGLPIGLQAIGPYLEDRMTIAFASMLEREFGGFTPPPGYLIELLQQSTDPFANAQIAGVNATVSQFIGMHGLRGRYRALFREFFRNFDVLLAPVTITPAFPHISDQVPILKRTLQVNGTEVPYMYLPIYAGVAAYSGLPATAFPWGQTRGGLPIGLQAIGPYLEDRMTIAFASMLEREFGGFTPPPGYP